MQLIKNLIGEIKQLTSYCGIKMNKDIKNAFIRQEKRRINFFKKEIKKRQEQYKLELKELKNKLLEAKNNIK